ncbi:MAG: hypothetical protein AABY27_01255, partial [Pseudomonadota bacterium]
YSKFYFPKKGDKKITDTTQENLIFTISNKEMLSIVSAVGNDKTPNVYMVDITLIGSQEERRY